MDLPDLLLLSDFEVSEYIDKVYQIFEEEIVNGKLSFLNLPITCPRNPLYDNKHSSFWHLISEKNGGNKEDNRIPDIRRCERIKWIPHVLKNATNEKHIWCWEKSIKTKRGKNEHVVLYMHQEKYLVVLRRKANRFEIVTAYIRENHKRMIEESQKYPDPRKSAEVA